MALLCDNRRGHYSEEQTVVGITSKSLLCRVSAGDEEAWRKLVDLYQPLIHGWLLRYGVRPHDAEDLTQDVLAIVVKEVASFEHRGRTGSFRSWLRTVTVNRAREFWRSGKCRTPAAGGFPQMLDQLADPQSVLSGQWDAEHDAHVIRRLLTILEQEFEPQTAQAFRLLVFERQKGADVAAALNMSLAAVYGAKSRVLQRFRVEAEGLLG
jgi:RNA polymerase sigma-70 factor (ECF subfamily)